LQQFKDDYDKNHPLWKILPEFCAKYPKYEHTGLRDLSQQIHDMYKANDVARVTTEMYLSNMLPAMKPSDAFACMAHREIDRVGGRVIGPRPAPGPRHAATRTAASVAGAGCAAAALGICAMRDASTQPAMRISMESPRAARTTGTFPPSTMPAASAPNMPVSILSMSAPASRLGTISTSALPAILDSTPLASAAAADMALSAVSGPSIAPPVII